MTKFIAVAAFAAVLCCLSGPATASDCAKHEPWGTPAVTDGHQLIAVCHAGYAAALDPATREPRWVAYELTAPHTLGCYPRTGLSFKVDSLAPAEDQGTQHDYAKSGYDLGHMAPNEDFAWSKIQQRESFSFSNVAPQLPGLNRQGWERLEEDVRAWALTRGDLEVYVGPIYGGQETIGTDKLPVPVAFYKVVVDRKTNEAVGFVMPQKAIKKGLAGPWRVSIASIDQQAKVSLPLPPHATEATVTWTANLSVWRAKHRVACAK